MIRDKEIIVQSYCIMTRHSSAEYQVDAIQIGQ